MSQTKCPYCESKEVVPIIYGEGHQLLRNSGNSFIGNDSPNKQCLQCHRGFGSMVEEMAEVYLKKQLQELNKQQDRQEFLKKIVISGKDPHMIKVAIKYITSKKVLLFLKLAAPDDLQNRITNRIRELKAEKLNS